MGKRQSLVPCYCVHKVTGESVICMLQSPQMLMYSDRYRNYLFRASSTGVTPRSLKSSHEGLGRARDPHRVLSSQRRLPLSRTHCAKLTALDRQQGVRERQPLEPDRQPLLLALIWTAGSGCLWRWMGSTRLRGHLYHRPPRRRPRGLVGQRTIYAGRACQRRRAACHRQDRSADGGDGNRRSSVQMLILRTVLSVRIPSLAAVEDWLVEQRERRTEH